jgi:beta-fructofuranosidase
MAQRLDKEDDVPGALPAKSDPHRPQYHFLPEANWINDPNGLIQWQGRYHLFYQYNPNGPFHGTIHWGHAVSLDLVHWTPLPIALAPSPGGPDQDGCWSGCAVNNHGLPTLLYTGVYPQTQCLAWSEDGLLTWKKHPGNPVLASPPPGLEVVGGPRWDWRDPWVWKENDTWSMLVGSGIRGVGGALLLYQSSDLIQWDYLHPLLVGDQLNLSEVWECPSLVPLGDKHLLLVSPVPESRHTYYMTGAYTRQKFSPATVGKTDDGPYFYAAQPLLDEQGRRLLWGWIKEGRDVQAQRAAGWSGVMSLPRVLDLQPDGALGMTPAPELAALRDRRDQWADLPLTSTARAVLSGLHGPCLEIMAEFEPQAARQFGLWVCCSVDQAERTLIAYDVVQQQLVMDRSRSSLSPTVDREAHTAPLALSAGERLRLHIFIDHSVVEIFANGRVCLTSRVYPTRPDSVHVELFALAGHAKVTSLDIWTLNPIWATPETGHDEHD